MLLMDDTSAHQRVVLDHLEIASWVVSPGSMGFSGSGYKRSRRNIASWHPLGDEEWMSDVNKRQQPHQWWHQIGQFVESGFAFAKSHKQQSTTRFWWLRNRIKFPGRIGSSNFQENHSNYTSKSDQWLENGLFHLLINGVYWGPKTLFFAGVWSIFCVRLACDKLLTPAETLDYWWSLDHQRPLRAEIHWEPWKERSGARWEIWVHHNESRWHNSQKVD